MDSTSALALENIPQKLLVVGGGYIGLELGTAYCELGSSVSVVAMPAGILPGCDRDLARLLEKRLRSKFSEIKLETKVTQMEDTGRSVKVTFENKEGKSSSEEYDNVLIAIGRRPNSKGLGLENTQVQ